MKKSKPPAGMKTLPRNTSGSKIAAGNYGGSGVKQKTGTQLDSYMNIPYKNSKIPKKTSLA